MTKICLSMLLFLSVTVLSCSDIDKASEANDLPGGCADWLPPTLMYGIATDSLDRKEYLIKPGDNLVSICCQLGFSLGKADSISRCSVRVLDPTKLRAGMHYTVFSATGANHAIRYIAFAKSLTQYAIVDLSGDSISASEYTKAVTFKRSYAEGVLNTSLWHFLKSGGWDPALALKLSDLFAWQIDFFDVKAGDSFQVVYDVAYIDDTTAIGIRSIAGALFTHQGKQFSAIPFTQDGVYAYFDTEGNSLRKAFLKAPLDMFRITSRFTNARFHPILKRYRAHHGVDYAAPTGTPVRSIGAGTVIAKGYEGGGGNFVKVKHNATYTTTYMHLSKFAGGLKNGSTVAQGEVIGYVGSTGLSTGPHLDFRVHKNGSPINPLALEAPPSLPVRAELKDSFLIATNRVYAELNRHRILHASRASVVYQESLYLQNVFGMDRLSD